ncbi:hypothetical protein [Rosenbergiella metrosideri]|nr:hypothetical protein [Rosenbergiella metrosideri]
MPFVPSFVNGFVQISVAYIAALGYVIDGAGFYQFPTIEYSLSQQNCAEFTPNSDSLDKKGKTSA